jgi:predicted Ser/Thr protein kinase
MKSYKRIYKGYNPKRNFNNLTKKEAFELELEIYKRVSGEDNFPKLISYDEKKLELIIENCGQSLDKINSLKIKNLDEQIKNICDVLKKHNIVHLDLHKNGKNLCYKDGKIYLIDFDITVIDGKPLSEKLRKIYNEYIIKDKTFEVIKNIFKNKKIV